MAELGYRPHRAARALRTGRSQKHRRWSWQRSPRSATPACSQAVFRRGIRPGVRPRGRLAPAVARASTVPSRTPARSGRRRRPRAERGDGARARRRKTPRGLDLVVVDSPGGTEAVRGSSESDHAGGAHAATVHLLVARTRHRLASRRPRRRRMQRPPARGTARGPRSKRRASSRRRSCTAAGAPPRGMPPAGELAPRSATCRRSSPRRPDGPRIACAPCTGRGAGCAGRGQRGGVRRRGGCRGLHPTADDRAAGLRRPRAARRRGAGGAHRGRLHRAHGRRLRRAHGGRTPDRGPPGR